MYSSRELQTIEAVLRDHVTLSNLIEINRSLNKNTNV